MVKTNMDETSRDSRNINAYYNIVRLNIFRVKHILCREGFRAGLLEILQGIAGVGKVGLKKTQKPLYRFYLKRKGKNPEDMIRENIRIDNPFEVIRIPVSFIENRVPTWVQEEYMDKYNFDFKALPGHGRKKERVAGLIMGGRWDIKKAKFENSAMYIAFKEHFHEGKKWEDTIYSKSFFERVLRKGKGRGGCENLEEFKEKYLVGKWDRLYQDISKNGYKSQEDLGRRPTKEIEVCVSRHGEILFRDGAHRLSIAKILGVKEVPVIVNVWHKDYIDRVKIKLCRENITPGEAIKPILGGL